MACIRMLNMLYKQAECKRPLHGVEAELYQPPNDAQKLSDKCSDFAFGDLAVTVGVEEMHKCLKPENFGSKNTLTTT